MAFLLAGFADRKREKGMKPLENEKNMKSICGMFLSRPGSLASLKSVFTVNTI